MEINKLRYVVFFIDSRNKDHDGKIFSSYKDAKDAVIDTLDDIHASKAAIGMFYIDPDAKEMTITLIETIGFKSDKKHITQLQLFKF